MNDSPWQRQVNLIKQLQEEIRKKDEYIAKLEKALGICGSYGSRYVSGAGWIRRPR